MNTPIKITGMQSLSEENSINASFDSIEKIVRYWEPTYTKQNFSIFSFAGHLQKDQKIMAPEKPYEITPIFALQGQTYAYVGDLGLEGVFVAKYDTGELPITIFQIYPSEQTSGGPKK